MKVRLTRKLADAIDGVDLTGRRVNEVFDLPSRQAALLFAEGWAGYDRRDQNDRRGLHEATKDLYGRLKEKIDELERDRRRNFRRSSDRNDPGRPPAED
jgi:hypothetical protein